MIFNLSGKKYNITASFDENRMPSLSDRLTDVVSRQQFTCIADTGHDRLEIHQAISSSEFMRGLAQGGVKHMGIEYFDALAEQIFRAYRDNKITDQDLQIIGQEIFLTSAEIDYNADPQQSRQTMIDYMVNAKKYGIELHQINNYEGIYTEEEQIKMADINAKYGQHFISVIENDKGFRDASPENKFSYLIQKVNDLFGEEGAQSIAAEYSALVQARQNRISEAIKSYVLEGLTLPEAQKKFEQDLLRTRFDQDYKVADRMRDIAGDEKAVIVYGRHHFDRRFFDLDSRLNAATIAIYADRKEQDMLRPPPPTDGFNWFYYQHMDYAYDLKTATWQKGDDPAVQLSPLLITSPEKSSLSQSEINPDNSKTKANVTP